ncbi:hypothetical protein GCM10027416_21880 [Okibacterium endophyticum]
MSSATARKHSLSPVPAPVRAPSAPSRIRAVPAAPATRTRPKLVYAIIVIGGVLGIVVAQLLLSVGISQGAYDVSSLQSRQTELDWQKQALAEEVAHISSPQYLAANAQALGMVIGGTPAYLRLSDAGIVGVPAAASAEESEYSGTLLVGNSLLDGVPLVTVSDGVVSESNAADSGASDAQAPPATISLENGLPSPNTR